MSEKLPKELWALIIGQLEEIRDFALVELVSKPFHALVFNHCWTKVRKISISGSWLKVRDRRTFINVKVETDTTEQEIHLPLSNPLSQAALLEKLVQKAIKTTALSVDLAWLTEQRHDQVLCCFFDALLAAQVKIKDLHLSRLHPDNHPRTIAALARFLSATQSLTSLKVVDEFKWKRPGPPKLLQAFRDCRSLESVEIKGVVPLVESILHGKTNLKSLMLYLHAAPTSALLESGAVLLQFTATSNFLSDYINEVNSRDLSLIHPLWAVERLTVSACLQMPTQFWGLFPNLEVLISDYFYFTKLTELVESFLSHWRSAGGQKALEFRTKEMWKDSSPTRASSEDLERAAAALEATCGCQATVIQGGGEARYTLFFIKKMPL